MNFWFECFYFLYIFSSVAVESSELEFHAKALGHVGLVISWDPMKVVNADEKYFNFTYEHEEELIVEGEVNVAKGEYKLKYPLNEDAQHDVTIQQCLHSVDIIERNYTFKGEIDLKNISQPEKPNFEWEVINYPSLLTFEMGIRIKWLPCGEEGSCHGKEPGTHFAVEYKILDSRKTEKVVEYFNDYFEIECIYAGRIYEITVISIYGNLETKSDPQEVFLEPGSSPVHSIRILTLTNTSIYLSWKKPKQFTEKISGYILTPNLGDSWRELHWYNPAFDINFIDALSDTGRIRCNDLKQFTANTFIIVPYGEKKIGFEYKFEYSIQPVQSNLPVAKPDFEFIYYGTENATCTWHVHWIPCVEIFDCKNTSAGSGFELIVQNENGTKTYTENKSNWIKIRTAKYQINKVTGISLNEFNQSSDSVIKTITCENP